MDMHMDINYRFKRNAEHELHMKYLISKAKLFVGYKDIMMLSAMIGYENEEFNSIDKVAPDRVLMNFFEDDDREIIDLMAYAHTKDQNILFSNEKYSIFESYYNGGFPMLLRLLELTEDKLNQEMENHYKELAIKLYRILITYKIEPKELELY